MVRGSAACFFSAFLAQLVLAACLTLAILPTTNVAAAAAAGTRKLPQFLHPRQPQAYVVHLPLNNNGDNNTTRMFLTLYSVIPDAVEKKVFLSFSFGKEAGSDQIEALLQHYPADGPNCHTNHTCVDLAPHFRTWRLGNLKCEFVQPDGKVMNVTPTPVEPYMVKVAAVFYAFIATCDMPPAFVDYLLLDDFANPPGIRVLRENAAADVPGVVANGTEGSFEDVSGYQCMHMKRVSEAKTLHDCAQRCHESAAPVPNKRANAATAQRLQTEQQVREYVAKLHAAKNKPNGPCNMWQWADRNGCFHSAKKMMASTCYENPRWKGGSRRHDVWDAVDTSRQVGERRLMTFGCSMAVRGDGSYSDRIPQWLEFQLINFPTAHFFVYLRGSDGYGSFDPYLSGGMPGVVGGVAVLYPYILAGVVTVIWLPRDGANLLNRYMDSYQKRDENDFLYRTRHFSQWISASIDYDEFFAPTHTATPAELRRYGYGGSAVFNSSIATDVDFSDPAIGPVFYPLHTLVEKVQDNVQVLFFNKWPAKLPDPEDNIYIGTTVIAKDRTMGRLGKYMIRPLYAKVLWTHQPLVPADDREEDFAKENTTKLVLGNSEYNLLHFRDKDWDIVVDEPKLQLPYQLTQDIALQVKYRLWRRYTQLPTAVRVEGN